MSARSRIAGVATGLLASMLASCADNKVAGATSETTNGDIKALITHSDGSVAVGARVFVVEDSLWLEKAADGRTVILDSGVTGADGQVVLKAPMDRRCNLQAMLGGEGFLERNAQDMADTGSGIRLHKINMTDLGRLGGILRADSGMAENIRIAGTLCSTLVSGDGQFSLTGVPAGLHPMVAGIYHSETELPALVRNIDLGIGENKDSLDLRVSPRSVLVDDFERGYGQTVLGRLVGAGRWFARSDSMEGGDSRNEVTLIGDTAAFAGSSLRVRHILGSKRAHPYSNVGFYVGTATIKGKVFDLTDVNSISFAVRGRGSLVMRFSSKAVNRLYMDSVHFVYTFPLPSTWTRMVIPLDSLKVPPNAPAALKAWPWSQAAKEVVAIDFKANPPTSVAGDTVDVDLDDIRLEGVPLEHYLP